jgi:hypothetical protein
MIDRDVTIFSTAVLQVRNKCDIWCIIIILFVSLLRSIIVVMWIVDVLCVCVKSIKARFEMDS